MAETMNNVPRKTLNENEIQSTKYYVRNYQINMQNKPNFPKAQISANSVCTRYYEYFIPLAGQKNKPNTNPNKPNLRKAKPNSNPISKKSKMNVNLYIIEDYENKRLCRPKKTNPNKPNFKPDSELLECPREFSLMVRAGQALYCRKRMTEDRGQFFVMMCFALSIRYSH